MTRRTMKVFYEWSIDQHRALRTFSTFHSAPLIKILGFFSSHFRFVLKWALAQEKLSQRMLSFTWEILARTQISFSETSLIWRQRLEHLAQRLRPSAISKIVLVGSTPLDMVKVMVLTSVDHQNILYMKSHNQVLTNQVLDGKKLTLLT